MAHQSSRNGESGKKLNVHCVEETTYRAQKPPQKATGCFKTTHLIKLNEIKSNKKKNLPRSEPTSVARSEKIKKATCN
jgi:hypothetical protein